MEEAKQLWKAFVHLCEEFGESPVEGELLLIIYLGSPVLRDILNQHNTVLEDCWDNVGTKIKKAF